MSFLLEEEDAQATLLETLAFIDACEDPSGESGTLGRQRDKERRQVPDEERRRRNDARRRQRRKQEKQNLQAEASALEQRLARLKSVARWQRDGPRDLVAANAAGSTDLRRGLQVPNIVADTLPAGCSWKKIAGAMLQARIDAEKYNAVLRKALTSELALADALRSAFDQHPAPLIPEVPWTGPEFHHVQQQCKSVGSSDTFRVEPSAVMRELMGMARSTLDQAKALSSATTRMTSRSPSISCDCNMRLDPITGPITELNSVTPLTSGFESVRELLHSKFRAISTARPPKRTHAQQMKMRRVNEDGCIETQYSLVWNSLEDNVTLEGFGTMSKSDETARTLLVHASKSYHRSGVLCFLKNGWVAVTGGGLNNSKECVLQIHYTLSVEQMEGCTTVDGEDITRMRNRIFRRLEQEVKEKTLAFRQRLLSETGHNDLVELLAENGY